MKLTSHDLMRNAMAKHAITADELIERIHKEIGGDRDRISEAVSHFVTGGPGSLAIHATIIDLAVQHESATVH